MFLQIACLVAVLVPGSYFAVYGAASDIRFWLQSHANLMKKATAEWREHEMQSQFLVEDPALDDPFVSNVYGLGSGLALVDSKLFSDGNNAREESLIDIVYVEQWEVIKKGDVLAETMRKEKLVFTGKSTFPLVIFSHNFASHSKPSECFLSAVTLSLQNFQKIKRTLKAPRLTADFFKNAHCDEHVAHTLVAMMDISFRYRAQMEVVKCESALMRVIIFWQVYEMLWKAVLGEECAIKSFSSLLQEPVNSVVPLQIFRRPYTLLLKDTNKKFAQVFRLNPENSGRRAEKEVIELPANGIILGPFAQDMFTWTSYSPMETISVFLNVSENLSQKLSQSPFFFAHQSHWAKPDVVGKALLGVSEYNAVRQYYLGKYKKMATCEILIESPRKSIFKSLKLREPATRVVPFAHVEAIEPFGICPYASPRTIENSNAEYFWSIAFSYSLYTPTCSEDKRKRKGFSSEWPECWPDLVMLPQKNMLSKPLKSSEMRIDPPDAICYGVHADIFQDLPFTKDLQGLRLMAEYSEMHAYCPPPK